MTTILIISLMIVMSGLGYSSYYLGRLEGIKDFVSLLDSYKNKDNVVTLTVLEGDVVAILALEEKK